MGNERVQPPVQKMPPVPQAPEATEADLLAQKELDLEAREKALDAKELAVKALGLKLDLEKQDKPSQAVSLAQADLIAAFAKGAVLVEATSRGIYPNCVRRKRGDQFRVNDINAYSKMWMKIVK